jgi:hypothetical protein
LIGLIAEPDWSFSWGHFSRPAVAKASRVVALPPERGTLADWRPPPQRDGLPFFVRFAFVNDDAESPGQIIYGTIETDKDRPYYRDRVTIRFGLLGTFALSDDNKNGSSITDQESAFLIHLNAIKQLVDFSSPSDAPGLFIE